MSKNEADKTGENLEAVERAIGGMIATRNRVPGDHGRGQAGGNAGAQDLAQIPEGAKPPASYVPLKDRSVRELQHELTETLNKALSIAAVINDRLG